VATAIGWPVRFVNYKPDTSKKGRQH